MRSCCTNGPIFATATCGSWRRGGACLTVLFAHPLFWWLRRTIRGDQELLADAAAAGQQPARLCPGTRPAGSHDRQRHAPANLGRRRHLGRPSSFSKRIAMLLDETFRISLKGSRRWRIKALAAMAIIGLACSLATFQPAKSTAGQSKPGENPPPTTRSQTTVRPAGICVDSANHPIAGAEVTLYENIDAGHSLLGRTRTDAAGQFQFDEMRLDDPATDEDVRSFSVVSRAKGKARTFDGFNQLMPLDRANNIQIKMLDATPIIGPRP